MKNRDLIREAADKLRDAGIPDADYDASQLFFYVFDMDKKTYLLHADDQALPEKTKEYFETVEERISRRPLQHIIGEAGFMDKLFYVNEDVLCPRQDTELLVEQAAKRLEPGMKLLDLCTGSGCVLISLLDMVRGTMGTGVDISQAAITVAQKNARRHNSRAKFVIGDLFEPVSGRYDVITCNPPYIKSSDIPGLMPEVRDHEPIGALDGGEDGLCFYRRIISEAHEYLNPGGFLIFETGVDQRDAVTAIFNNNGYTDIECFRDYADNDRVVLGKRGENHAEESGE